MKFFSLKISRRYLEITWINHLLFWVFLLVFLLILDRTNQPFQFVFIKEMINLCFFAPIIYLNIYILIPRFLDKGKFISYFFLLIGLIAILTPLKVTVSYLIHYQNPNQQHFFLNNQYLIFIELLFVGIASMIFTLITNIFKHQQEKRELQEQNLTSELKFLKSQIDPHFFFNTLNSLYALTLKKSESAPNTVLKLSEIMRYMLYECNGKTVSLDKEVQYVKNYLDLEKIRYGNELDIQVDIKGDTQGKSIMPLIFSPFIENSFKHGINTSVEDAYINIQMNINSDKLHFEIENSKGPITKNKSTLSGGIGLNNVKRRLKLEYPNEHSLNITDTDNKYKIELDIKLNKNGL